jgi:hypothetical protein
MREEEEEEMEENHVNELPSEYHAPRQTDFSLRKEALKNKKVKN